MAEFADDELRLVRRIAKSRGEGKDYFTFKGLHMELREELDLPEPQAKALALNLGKRIKMSVKDADDPKLPFRIERVYDEHQVKLRDGSLVSYVYVPD